MSQAARVSSLDLPSALRVLRLLEVVADAGVDNDERQPRGKRYVAVVAGSAIEQQRVATARQEDAGGIHQSDGDAGGGQLGLLGEPGQFERVEVERGRAAECQRERDGEGGRRGQPAPDRDRRRDDGIDADRRTSSGVE